MRPLRFVAALLLLVALAVAAWVFLWRRAEPTQPPAPYILVEPPTWLPAHTPPTVESAAGEAGGAAEAPEFPFGARKVLRIATLRNDDAQAYGFGGVAVYERGSQASLHVFLPPLPSGDGYDAWIVMDDGAVLLIGRMEDSGDDWHGAGADFPDNDLPAAQSLRITASTPNESTLDGMTVVEGALNDAID